MAIYFSIQTRKLLRLKQGTINNHSGSTGIGTAPDKLRQIITLIIRLLMYARWVFGNLIPFSPSIFSLGVQELEAWELHFLESLPAGLWCQMKTMSIIHVRFQRQKKKTIETIITPLRQVVTYVFIECIREVLPTVSKYLPIKYSVQCCGQLKSLEAISCSSCAS